MNTKLSKPKRTVIFLAGISAASIPTMAQADWSFVGLGTFGESYSVATGINDSEQVMGAAYLESYEQPRFHHGS